MVVIDESLPCVVCSQQEKPIYHIEQAYFTLYGLPLAPLGKKFYTICSSCKARLKAQSSDANLTVIRQELPGSFKFKYLWGWLVVLGIVGVVYRILVSAEIV